MPQHCGRIEADLVKTVAEVEKRTSSIIKVPFKSFPVYWVAVSKCQSGEAKTRQIVLCAFGKGNGLIMVKGEIVAKLKESELVDRFVDE